LGMKSVLIHPLSGLLSAYGMGLADIRATRTQALEETLGAEALASIGKIGARLGDEVRGEVSSQGVPDSDIEVIVRAHLRYAGTDTPLEVVAGTEAAMQEAFEAAHKARFGFMDRDKEIVV